jgi:energy-coupling factor transport system ATP-binding protein
VPIDAGRVGGCTVSLSFEDVSFSYAPGTVFEVAAVRDITLRIDDGEYVAVMGRTGSGKSTLGLLGAGLLKPSSGRVLIDDHDLAEGKLSAVRRRVGVIFQYPERQLFESTVERDVAFALRGASLSKEEVTARVHDALRTVGLDPDEVGDSSPLALSGGEQRRVAIAGILVTRPTLLILDEPTAGLDPAGRSSFLALIDNLNAAGTTVVLISHDGEAVAEHADRLILLADGQIVLDTATAQAFGHFDMLRRCGVGLPPAAQVVRLLDDVGRKVPEDICRYDDLFPHLLALARAR